MRVHLTRERILPGFVCVFTIMVINSFACTCSVERAHEEGAGPQPARSFSLMRYADPDGNIWYSLFPNEISSTSAAHFIHSPLRSTTEKGVIEHLDSFGPSIIVVLQWQCIDVPGYSIMPLQAAEQDAFYKLAAAHGHIVP